MNICKTCAWFDDSTCHRYPPTILDDGETCWPTVYENEFCGEHSGEEQ